MIFYKKFSGLSGISYEELVEEALCFGWIDGFVKKIDEKRYVRRFSPRKSTSSWLELNRRRVEKMFREEG